MDVDSFGQQVPNLLRVADWFSVVVEGELISGDETLELGEECCSISGTLEKTKQVAFEIVEFDMPVKERRNACGTLSFDPRQGAGHRALADLDHGAGRMNMERHHVRSETT